MNQYWWYFGLIANAIVFVVALMSCIAFIFHKRYQNDVKEGLQQEPYFENSELSEKDIGHLPEPVKKYLRFSGSMGKPKINNFKVEFAGKIRKDEQSEWMPFTSQQYNFMHTPTRLFFMKATMKMLPIAGYHSFKNGTAFMDIRLFSLFRVKYQQGPEMDWAETVTFFNDMCCLAPATLIDKRIKWLEVKENQVNSTFTNNHISVSACLYFNDDGALINFISQDRFSADAGIQLPWATPVTDYQQINGYNLMLNAQTIYSYPNRDLTYGTFTLVGVAYNCKP